MEMQPRSWWQKIKQHPFILVGIVVTIFALTIFTLAVSKFGWDWTGFTGGESKITLTSTSKGTATTTELQPAKSLWDWLGLLAALAIPVVVGIGAAWFTTQQAKASDRENTDNQHEVALQAYIDKISELLLKEHLGDLTADGKVKPEYKHVRNIARVRTITVLMQLNARRVGYVFSFLHEAGLMSTTTLCEARLMSTSPNENVVNLVGADLRAVNWSQADLFRANLSGANLSRASLTITDLSGANLSGANLSNADLRGANLVDANLSGANLSNAVLSWSDFSGADLTPPQLLSQPERSQP